jgi:hypothetical protein
MASFIYWAGDSSKKHLVVGGDTSLPALKSPHLNIHVPFNDG